MCRIHTTLLNPKKKKKNEIIKMKIAMQNKVKTGRNRDEVMIPMLAGGALLSSESRM